MSCKERHNAGRQARRWSASVTAVACTPWFGLAGVGICPRAWPPCPLALPSRLLPTGRTRITRARLPLLPHRPMLLRYRGLIELENRGHIRHKLYGFVRRIELNGAVQEEEVRLFGSVPLHLAD